MTLSDSIREELDRLTALAEAATPWKDYSGDDEPFQIQYGDFGPGIVGTPMGEWEDSEQGRADAAFARSVANPADALRRYAAARDMLKLADEYDAKAKRFGPPTEDIEPMGRIVWLILTDAANDLRALTAASLGIEVSP